MRYLFDASSIFDSITHGKISSLMKNYTPNIANYEICNALWKNTSLLKTFTPNESFQMLELFTQLFNEMIILDLSGHERGIYVLSLETGMPFYDSTYLYFALQGSHVLVSEDKKMRKSAGLLGLDCVSIKEL